MGKKRRPEGAKPKTFWLSPAAVETLDLWQEARGYADRTDTLEAILGAVRRKLDGGGAQDRPDSDPESSTEPTRLEDHPAAGWCSACGRRQYSTPSGDTCGEHGGAPPGPDRPSKRHRWHHGEWLDPEDPTEAAILDGAETARRGDETTVEDVEGYQEEDDLAEDHYDDPNPEWDGYGDGHDDEARP